MRYAHISASGSSGDLETELLGTGIAPTRGRLRCITSTASSGLIVLSRIFSVFRIQYGVRPVWHRRVPEKLYFVVGANPSNQGCVSKMNATVPQARPSASGVLPLAAWTDERLLLEYRSRRDERVFEELVKRYESELFGYLRHYLGSAEMAEDVFQQTFLQVHLKCDQFEPGRKVRPWIYAIATNQAIDYQRRNQRHRVSSLDRLGLQSDQEETPGADWIKQSEDGPAEGAESAEQRETLRRAVDDLPEQSRQIVMMVYFQGLKCREAAEALLIPVGTVKSRLHTAMQRLTESLAHASSH